VFFDVRNLQPHLGGGDVGLKVLGGPHCFFRRLRILAGNQLIEDIDYYARTHQMFDILRARHVRENEDSEGFEHRFDQPPYASILHSNKNSATEIVYPFGKMEDFGLKYLSVLPGQAKTVSFKPLSGLLSCGKLLPLKYCPITIELELCSSMFDPIICNGNDACGIRIGGLNKNTSQSWQIENPCVKVDICVLDNALNNEYAALLLSGKALPINYSSYVTQMQSISGPTPSVNITRALSRLKSVFVTLDRNIDDDRRDEFNLHIDLWKKWWNDFYHPMSHSSGHYTANAEYEAQLQVGSKLFPTYPVRSIQEAFYQLRKCMGVEASNFHSLDITPWEYRNNKFVMAFDTEKMLGTAFSGTNIKTGSLMTLKMKTNSPYPADQCYMVMHFDSILSIRDSGIEVFE
jgi:hypothetical protein